MDVCYTRCAGLYVHKKSVVACRIETQAEGRKVAETRTFGTTTRQLLDLLTWLLEPTWPSPGCWLTMMPRSTAD